MRKDDVIASFINVSGFMYRIKPRKTCHHNLPQGTEMNLSALVYTAIVIDTESTADSSMW